MKKAWNQLVETIKARDYTNREAVLSALLLFLLGIVLGIFFSPNKSTMIGSNNGNNNKGAFDKRLLEEEEEVEDKKNN